MEDDHGRIEEGTDPGWTAQCLQPLFPVGEDTSDDCDIPQTLVPGIPTHPGSRGKCTKKGSALLIPKVT